MSILLLSIVHNIWPDCGTVRCVFGCRDRVAALVARPAPCLVRGSFPLTRSEQGLEPKAKIQSRAVSGSFFENRYHSRPNAVPLNAVIHGGGNMKSNSKIRGGHSRFM